MCVEERKAPESPMPEKVFHLEVDVGGKNYWERGCNAGNKAFFDDDMPENFGNQQKKAGRSGGAVRTAWHGSQLI